MPTNNKELTTEIASAKRDTTALYMPGGIVSSPDETLLTRGQGLYKIYDSLLRDGHCRAILQKRKLALIAREWQVEPASKDKADEKAADMVRYQLKNLGQKQEISGVGFDRICENLLDAILKGFAIGEAIWEMDGKEIYLETVLPKHQDRFSFIVSEKGGYELRLLVPENSIQGISVPANKFIIHSFGSSDGNPLGRGLGESLWWDVYFKRQGIQFWLIFLDKYASPTAIGKYGKGATEQQKKTLLEALQAIAHDAGVIIPEGMIIELLEASRSSSVQTYESLCNYMDAQMSKIVLGETGTTDQQGSGGSRARDQIGNEVRLEIVKADADLLSETLNRTIVSWIVQLNIPNANPPRVFRVFEEQEDLNSRVNRDKSLFDMGWKLKPDSLAEIYGDNYEKPEEDTPEQKNNSFLVNSGIKNNASEETTTEPQRQEEILQENLPKETTEELAEPPEIESTPADLFAKQATKSADEAISQILDPIEKLLKKTESFEEFQQQLLSLYPQISSSKFANLMTQALIASEAAGRYEVIQESPEVEFVSTNLIDELGEFLSLEELDRLCDLLSDRPAASEIDLIAIPNFFFEGLEEYLLAPPNFSEHIKQRTVQKDEVIQESPEVEFASTDLIEEFGEFLSLGELDRLCDLLSDRPAASEIDLIAIPNFSFKELEEYLLSPDFSKYIKQKQQ